ncbi:MAG: GGDEF domain-containing protein, partial [Spirochaetia bacterium]|nr:GGDEF domain-containing protein [Spirochaetia bacterium]
IITTLTSDYYNQIGKSGLAILSQIVKGIHVSNADIKRLRSLKYKDLPYDKTNIAIENAFKDSASIIHARYVYLMRGLEPDEVTEFVEESDAGYYNAPVGTPLNLMWLMNVVYGDDKSLTNADFSEHYFKDKYRFSYFRPAQSDIYLKKEPVYVYTSDEFGEKYITAYLPFHTVEGQFVGMFGLDIFHDQYIKFLEDVCIFFISAPIVIFFLILFSSIIYISNKEKLTMLKLVSEKVALDALTGIYNRNWLEEFSNTYSTLKESGSSITIIMIDVDNFKHVNDTYGHDAGDSVLLGVSNVLKASIRTPYDYPIRIGGDEFMVIFTNLSSELVMSISTRFVDNVSSSKFVRGIETSVSVGVSSLSVMDDSKNLSSLMKEADHALYRAKKKGKNLVVSYSEAD